MKQIQQKIKQFCEENNLNCPPEHRLLDTMSELGEVAKEVLKMIWERQSFPDLII